MDSVLSSSVDQSSLQCTVCGRMLASLSGLMEHKRIHTGERPYGCQICNKRFTQKAHLVIHKRTHTGEKPYACHICHKRFAQSSHLNNHKRIHTGEKPYFCNLCNMGFSRKQRLELHVLQHAQSSQSEDIGNKTYGSESELYPRPTNIDSTQIHMMPASTSDTSVQSLGFFHRRKPVYVTRVSNEEYENIQSEFDQSANDHSSSSFQLGPLSGQQPIMKSEPKDFDELEVISRELDAIARPNMNLLGGSEAVSSNELMNRHASEESMEQSTSERMNTLLEHSFVLQNERRELHQNSDDMNGMCAVSTTDNQNNTSGDDGDGASITSESNNSNSDQSINTSSKKNMLGHSLNKASKSMHSPVHRAGQKHVPAKAATSMPTVAPSSLVRTNSRICLVDFTTDELITHLMSRDDVYRCDFCCILFQDAAMYHLHRSMHDKMDIRCCNLCGKLSKEKYDFVAHFLTEHK